MLRVIVLCAVVRTLTSLCKSVAVMKHVDAKILSPLWQYWHTMWQSRHGIRCSANKLKKIFWAISISDYIWLLQLMDIIYVGIYAGKEAYLQSPCPQCSCLAIPDCLRSVWLNNIISTTIRLNISYKTSSLFLVKSDYLPSIWLSMAWLTFSILSLTRLVLDTRSTIVCTEWTLITHLVKLMHTRVSTFELHLHTDASKRRRLMSIEVYFSELGRLYDAFCFP